MYMYKMGIDIKINKAKASREIGCDVSWLSQVMNRRVACSKMLAYCITKYLDENAEISDFFERVN